MVRLAELMKIMFGLLLPEALVLTDVALVVVVPGTVIKVMKVAGVR